MAQRKPGTKAALKSAKGTAATKKRYDGFTDEERAAMKDRVEEMRVSGRKADLESEVLAKIADLPKSDRALAERVHKIIKVSAPAL